MHPDPLLQEGGSPGGLLPHVGRPAPHFRAPPLWEPTCHEDSGSLVVTHSACSKRVRSSAATTANTRTLCPPRKRPHGQPVPVPLSPAGLPAGSRHCDSGSPPLPQDTSGGDSCTSEEEPTFDPGYEPDWAVISTVRPRPRPSEPPRGRPSWWSWGQQGGVQDRPVPAPG